MVRIGGIGFIALALGCKGKDTAQETAAPKLSPEAQKRQDIIDTVAGIKTTLTDLKAHLPPASSFTKETPCPPDVVEAIKGKALATIDTATIDAVIATPASNRGITFDDHLSDPEIGDFRRSWTGTPDGIELLSLPGAIFSVNQGHVFKRSHIRLVVPVEKTLPKQSGPESFTPGVIDGWLAVIDLATYKSVCHAPVRATNTEKISYYAIHDPQAYLENDLGQNFIAAAVRAYDRILPGGGIYNKHVDKGEVVDGYVPD